MQVLIGLTLSMKTLLKLALLFIFLICLLAGAAFFVVTRPGFQKSLIEKRLPPGSSLRSVQITTSSIEFSGLKLVLADGTKVRVENLDTDFKPLAALFDQTIRMGALEMEGIVVELPRSFIAETSQAPATTEGTEPSVTTQNAPATTQAGESDVSAPPSSFLDLVYSVGQFEWLLDIDSVSIDGELRNADGAVFGLKLKSDAIRPGERSNMEAALNLRSSQPLPSGIQNFDASTRLQVQQKPGGGFEEVSIESVVDSKDGNGALLLSLTQSLQMSVDSFAEEAEVRAALNAELPRPGVFDARLLDMPALGVQSAFDLSVTGERIRLNKADFLMTSGGQTVAELALKQSFQIGSGQQMTGDVMDLRLREVPLSWLKPFMPEGIALTGAPLSMDVAFKGEPDGRLLLESREPLQVGPISVSRDGQALLESVSLIATPKLYVSEAQSYAWELAGFQLQDRYGKLISGESSGRMDSIENASGIDAMEIETETTLDLGLTELSQQPFLRSRSSVLTGRARVHLKMDPEARYPYQVQCAIEGLSSREFPGQRQDYRFALQLQEPQSDVYALGLNLQAGSEGRPSSSAQMAAQYRVDSEPLAFDFDLSGPLITQRDIGILLSALSPRADASDSQAPSAQPDVAPPTRSTARSASEGTAVVPPPWSGLNGPFKLRVDTLVLNSGQTIENFRAEGQVSEPLLALNSLNASFGQGRAEGQGAIRFKAAEAKPYQIESTFRFRGVDPSIFADRRSKPFPVRGQFGGDLSFTGAGRTLERALENAEGDLGINGRDGVLTAFEVDRSKQIGLIGAGLLGDQLNRPGIAALAQTIPYFENIPFETFTLQLTRGADRNVLIPKLQFKGENVLLNGSGFIAATRLREILDQPLDLTLELGAKGKLIGYLEKLELLGSETTTDGFRRWATAIEIGGTLGDPDTSALQGMLSAAAKRAFIRAPAETPNAEPPADASAEGSATEAPQLKEGETKPKKKSKEQKILEDVETGLDLLNTVLGG